MSIQYNLFIIFQVLISILLNLFLDIFRTFILDININFSLNNLVLENVLLKTLIYETLLIKNVKYIKYTNATFIKVHKKIRLVKVGVIK